MTGGCSARGIYSIESSQLNCVRSDRSDRSRFAQDGSELNGQVQLIPAPAKSISGHCPASIAAHGQASTALPRSTPTSRGRRAPDLRFQGGPNGWGEDGWRRRRRLPFPVWSPTVQPAGPGRLCMDAPPSAAVDRRRPCAAAGLSATPLRSQQARGRSEQYETALVACCRRCLPVVTAPQAEPARTRNHVLRL